MPKRKMILVGVGGLVLICVCLGVFTLMSNDDEGTVFESPIETGSAAEAVSEPTEEPVSQSADAPIEEPTEAPPTSTPVPTETAVPTDTPVPTPTPNPNLIKSGTYIVGTDIQPGLYQGVAEYDLFGSCYWARLSDLTGDFGALLANENSIGQYYVEVKDDDFAFETKCEILFLESLPEPPDEFPQKIMPGTYIIGHDIEAGTYRGEAGDDIMESCYWARLSGVSGDFNDLITNDNATGQFYVQIQESDFALATACELELTE